MPALPPAEMQFWKLRKIPGTNRAAVDTTVAPAVLLRKDQAQAVSYLQGDISEFQEVERSVLDQAITRIHLAACKCPLARAATPWRFNARVG